VQIKYLLQFGTHYFVLSFVVQNYKHSDMYNHILPVVLYGCETSSVTLREKYRLKVFGNMMLREIYGAKGEEVTGDWRKLPNDELHGL